MIVYRGTTDKRQRSNDKLKITLSMDKRSTELETMNLTNVGKKFSKYTTECEMKLNLSRVKKHCQSI